MSKWLTEEMIKEFMDAKDCSREHAIKVLSLIPDEILPLSKKDMEYGIRLAKELQERKDGAEPKKL